MAKELIALDLLRQGAYAPLKTRLAAMGARQILERVWAVLESSRNPGVQSLTY